MNLQTPEHENAEQFAGQAKDAIVYTVTHGIKSDFKALRSAGREDIWGQEVEEGPQLMQVVLQGRACENHLWG